MEHISLVSKNKDISLPVLYEKYSLDIFRYSYSILKNEEDAQDAVQDVFVKYAEDKNSFKGNCSIKTWLLVLTRNYCYNKRKSKNNSNLRIDKDDPVFMSDPGYEDHITLKDALSRLSHDYNELIYLKDYEGYSYIEIAEITSQSIENVKIKLFRARQELRKFFKE